jgi:hypothetical protein
LHSPKAEDESLAGQVSQWTLLKWPFCGLKGGPGLPWLAQKPLTRPPRNCLIFKGLNHSNPIAQKQMILGAKRSESTIQTRELEDYCQRRGWQLAGCYVDTEISESKD